MPARRKVEDLRRDYPALVVNSGTNVLGIGGMHTLYLEKCDGRTAWGWDVKGKPVTIPISLVRLREVSKCDHKIDEEGHLLARPKGCEEWDDLGAWDKYEPLPPPKPKPKRGEGVDLGEDFGL